MKKNLVFFPKTDGVEWKVYSFKRSLTIIHCLCRFTKTQLNSNFLLSKLQSQGCLLQAAFRFLCSLICTKYLQLYPWNKNRQEVCLNVATSPPAACQLPSLASCHLLASKGIELMNWTFSSWPFQTRRKPSQHSSTTSTGHYYIRTSANCSFAGI